MLIDTGSQISLIKNRIISDKSLINTENKITISSIHGSENTIGDISAFIRKNEATIPIQLQVADDLSLQEDGIIGFDVLGKNATIDGPTKTISFKTGETSVHFPINNGNRDHQINMIKLQEEENQSQELYQILQEFQEISYIDEQELKENYTANYEKVQEITHEIDESRILIQKKI